MKSYEFYIGLNDLIIRNRKMNQHEKINYIEIPTKDIEATKSFFTKTFGWSFIDYGLEYTAFSDQGIDGGFFKADHSVSTENGSVLIVFYSKDLEQTHDKIMDAGGRIIKPETKIPNVGAYAVFSDPDGNTLAIFKPK